MPQLPRFAGRHQRLGDRHRRQWGRSCASPQYQAPGCSVMGSSELRTLVTRSTSPIAVASLEGTTWFGVQHRQVPGRRHRTDVRDAACAVAPRLRGRPVAAVACQTRHRCQHLGCCGRQWAGIAGSDVSPEIYSVRLAKWCGVGAVDRGVGDAARQNQDAGSCPDADLYSGLLELISMALKTRRLC
jgi:hypothetical protein